MSAPISSLSLSPSLARASSIFESQFRISQKSHQLTIPLKPPIFSTSVPTRRTLDFHEQRTRVHSKSTNFWRLPATSEEISTTVDAAQEVVSSASGDDGVTVVIQVLLVVAFAALSVLTIGVIYIGVTDFLQKREKDKFEKEEAAKKSKKGGKKKAIRSKAGPRGFGQKIDVDDDDFDV